MDKTIKLYGFSSNQSPEAVKDLLEAFTGKGTVHDVKFFPLKDGQSRTFAIVEFRHSEFSDMILTLAHDRQLWCNESYLKAQKSKFKLVPNPMLENFEHGMKIVKMHFGSPISVERFSVLWTTSDVSVIIGMEFKNIYLFFSYDSVEYKLDISSESIGQIDLRHSRAQLSEFLLIQLLGAPRIYKKCSQYDWVREIDFTPSCCIGQSSAICFELPSGCELPNLLKSFVNYKKIEDRFFLEEGSTFSCNSTLVPIVHSPVGITLPYKILFKINSLVQQGCIPGQALNITFYELVDPIRVRIEYIESALDRLFRLKECCYEPAHWLREQYKEYMASKQIPQSSAISLDGGLVYVHRVQVTPSKIYFCGPEVNLSNRVLRNYSEDIDNFLRVSFVDEDLGKIRSVDLCIPRECTTSTEEEMRTRVYERILSTLRNGIVIGEKKFEFLAFSSSQLREHSVWMFSSRNELSAQDIRSWMGDFSGIRNVAKYAARLGQAFSSSMETFSVGRDEIEFIPDVITERGGVKYCFSDGIGKISAEFAGRVASKCGKTTTPSAFQIRHGGHKGVVAVDPTLSRPALSNLGPFGTRFCMIFRLYSIIKIWTSTYTRLKNILRALSYWEPNAWEVLTQGDGRPCVLSKNLAFRESMCKYQSKNTTLDVLAWSRYQPYFLNRQVIMLLSTLGVQDHVFERKQTQALNWLESVLTNPLRAEEALKTIFQGDITKALKGMLACGYKPDAEPFLSLMLRAFYVSKLVELRTKTRIFIPNGQSLMGCLDETGTLEYGQVFVQCSRRVILSANSTTSIEDRFIVEGKVVVAKNPCLHPGDLRVLSAVNIPALHHLVDCVVFPQKGKRPHPNECSGSDLDGDFYLVSWDPDLIPPRQVPPMNYAPAPTIELDHGVTMEEVQKSFTDYIVNDNLGQICNAHTVLADRMKNKASSAPCLKLAKLCSYAVDSPKTGIVVKLPRSLRPSEYPNFMEKDDEPSYESKRVIGKLYRQVKATELASHSRPSSIKSFTLEVAKKYYDHDIEVDGFEDYINEAINYKCQYDFKLGNLMDYYGIKTEADILSGSLTIVPKSFNKGNDLESIKYSVRSLKMEARSWFNEMPGSSVKSYSSADNRDEYAAKASAWYHVTYHPRYWGRYNEGIERDHFLSFPWCVFDKLLQIKRDKTSVRNSSIVSLSEPDRTRQTQH